MGNCIDCASGVLLAFRLCHSVAPAYVSSGVSSCASLLGYEKIDYYSVQIDVVRPNQVERGENWAYVETIADNGAVTQRYVWLPAVMGK